MNKTFDSIRTSPTYSHSAQREITHLLLSSLEVQIIGSLRGEDCIKERTHLFPPHPINCQSQIIHYTEAVYLFFLFKNIFKHSLFAIMVHLRDTRRDESSREARLARGDSLRNTYTSATRKLARELCIAPEVCPSSTG